jgi:tetratricopeptide (TPR) repeat protein
MGQREAATAIVLRLGEAPDDPAAATLLALARDNASDAADARRAAARVLAARPPSPRALQAAARVFHRLGAWDEAVAAGEAAVQAGGGADGGGLLRESRWRDHPLPWLVEAETAKGRFARARARLAGVTARFDRVAPSLGPRAAWRLRALIDVSWFRLRWAMVDWVASPVWPDPDLASFASPTPAPPDGDAASEDDRALYAEATGVRACVEGLLAARAAWPRGEPDRLARARSAAAHLDTLAILYAAPPRFELLATQVRVATSAALEAREEIALLTAHTASLEHRLAEAGTLVPPIVRADQLAGDVHLQLRDWREAFWRYAALTRQEPQNARAWLGAARAARRLGEAAAASMARTFLGLWGGADKDRPELVEAHQIAGAP